jgi:hypothetical protein
VRGCVKPVSMDPGPHKLRDHAKTTRVPVTRPLRACDSSLRVTQGTRGRVAYFYVKIVTLRTNNVQDHAPRVLSRSVCRGFCI